MENNAEIENITTDTSESIPVAIDSATEEITTAVVDEVMSETTAGKRAWKGERKKNERRPSRKPERAKQEFDNKILSLRRVTRVIAGGRRFSFSCAIAIGDKKGRVGIGLGKAQDTPIAVEKAVRDAKKNMIKVKLTERSSIPHQVDAKYASAVVSIVPAPGKGIVAGSAVRTVLELSGITEVTSKIYSRSKNRLNIARAAILALDRLK